MISRGSVVDGSHKLLRQPYARKNIAELSQYNGKLVVLIYEMSALYTEVNTSLAS